MRRGSKRPQTLSDVISARFTTQIHPQSRARPRNYFPVRLDSRQMQRLIRSEPKFCNVGGYPVRQRLGRCRVAAAIGDVLPVIAR
jgi:hypothetical protein